MSFYIDENMYLCSCFCGLHNRSRIGTSILKGQRLAAVRYCHEKSEKFRLYKVKLYFA